MVTLFKRPKTFIKSILYRRSKRIFCISIQRTGTTSVGKFFRDFGYRWAGWPIDQKNHLSKSWYDGDFEKIFSSVDFLAANAFEDSPWYLPGFYKILFHRFPDAKFILLTRDTDSWFQSMVHHSQGNIIGASRIHCKAYRREIEYFNLLHAGSLDEHKENQNFSTKTLKLNGYQDHYKNLYRLHTLEVQDFFNRHSPESLHHGELDDPQKWQKLGEFLGINVSKSYDSHENHSPE